MLVNFYNKTGFTLLELIVVIAIIGLLSTILYASFDVAKAQSRDKVRMASLKELQLAIELYKAQNGEYPLAGCSVGAYDVGNYRWAGSETYTANNLISCPNNYVSGLVPDFIPKLPVEVGGTKIDKGYIYAVSTDRQAYKLMGHHNVETINISGYDDNFARYPIPCPPTYPNDFPVGEKDVYAVYSVGAECW